MSKTSVTLESVLLSPAENSMSYAMSADVRQEHEKRERDSNMLLINRPLRAARNQRRRRVPEKSACASQGAAVHASAERPPSANNICQETYAADAAIHTPRAATYHARQRHRYQLGVNR